MYPPILSTLKFVPVSESLKTDTGEVTIVLDVGFLYEKLIFIYFVFLFYLLMLC